MTRPRSSSRQRLTLRQWFGWFGLAAVAVFVLGSLVWRGDILRAGLDPQQPFQTYSPPPAPDYARPESWALLDTKAPQAGDVPVFFVAPTTFAGKGEWNGPIDDAAARAYLARVVVPNHVGPFERAGPISLPYYRQGSLYTRLTLRDDAREARAFAFDDVARAFEAWISRHPDGPLVLAGMEQGGELLARLLADPVHMTPARRERVVAVYLSDTIVPADFAALPACTSPTSTGCLIAYSSVDEGTEGAAQRRLRRALVWNTRGALVDLGGRPALCVNPVTGSVLDPRSETRESQGATNATGLEWGLQPALQGREVAAECRDGILFHTRPRSQSYADTGGWIERRLPRPYNLFYGDLQKDVEHRLATWAARSAL